MRTFIAEKCPGFIFVPLRLEDAFDPEWWKRMTGLESSSSTNVDLRDEGK